MLVPAAAAVRVGLNGRHGYCRSHHAERESHNYEVFHILFSLHMNR